MRVTKGSYWDYLMQDLGMRPKYKEPEENPLRIYGGDKTIHRTGEVNVELDIDGKVVAVWFRCQTLPFTQNVVDWQRAESMRRSYAEYPVPSLDAVVLREKA